MRNASERITLARGGDSGSREGPLTARIGMEAIAITGGTRNKSGQSDRRPLTGESEGK
jgi:hypothetical protein